MRKHMCRNNGRGKICYWQSNGYEEREIEKEIETEEERKRKRERKGEREREWLQERDGHIMWGKAEKELKKQIVLDKERIGKEKGWERELDILCT